MDGVYVYERLDAVSCCGGVVQLGCQLACVLHVVGRINHDLSRLLAPVVPTVVGLPQVGIDWIGLRGLH
jgi:hypothetical protein